MGLEFVGADDVRGEAQRNEYPWGIRPDDDHRISDRADVGIGPYGEVR